MPVSAALKRLLRIRELEQEQHRLALASALAEMRTLEEALSGAALRERGGRGEFTTGVRTGELLRRQTGLAETVIGRQHTHLLMPALSRAEVEAARRRHEFLRKRVEHRQAETLLQEAAAEDALEEMRQGQQTLDDWFLARAVRGLRGSSLADREVSSRLTGVDAGESRIVRD